MKFADSVRKNVAKILSEIDTTMYKISDKLFREVIYKCPVLRGNLINDFHVKVNGYDLTSTTNSYIVDGQSSEGPNSNKTGVDSLKRIKAAASITPWKGADGFISMSTSVLYAHRIEFLNWSTQRPEGFIRNSLTEVAAQVRQGNL